MPTYTPLHTISQQELPSIFEWIPTCLLVIDRQVNIVDVNSRALLFFKSETKDSFFESIKKFDIFVDIQYLLEIINQIAIEYVPTSSKFLIRKLDKTIANVDVEFAMFPNYENFILLQFTDNSHQSQAVFEDLISSFRNDTLQLKPYLNKPGKELLNKIIYNEKLEGIIKNKPSRARHLEIVQRQRIVQLSVMFPEFSKIELAFCGFLSLKLTIEEIANITGKTSNSLRVAFHRILGKTKYSNGKELLSKLESLK